MSATGQPAAPGDSAVQRAIERALIETPGAELGVVLAKSRLRTADGASVEVGRSTGSARSRRSSLKHGPTEIRHDRPRSTRS